MASPPEKCWNQGNTLSIPVNLSSKWRFVGYNINLGTVFVMSYINLKQLNELVHNERLDACFEETADKFYQKYHLKLQHEELQNLVQMASKINKREKHKQNRHKGQLQSDYEIFVFGQLKIFNWVLVLYSHIHSLDLTDFNDQNFTKIQSIFKRKTKLFIQYQIADMTCSKNKFTTEWSEDEIELFKDIVNSKQCESEWKYISYLLFCRSSGKYFRSFAMCREKWISHLNPNIKKTEWTLEEDVQLFTIIQNYGCRWALISRQFKGIRSEHSVKNRYNVLVKTIRKQYRLGDTGLLNDKIFKYLKLKLQKQQESANELNNSGISMDSKCSRERSREEEKLRLNDSQDESERCVEEVKNFNVFDEVYNMEAEPSNTETNSLVQHFQEFALTDYYKELKEQKKTNDNEEEAEPDCMREIKEEAVKTSTIEELDFEYNRLFTMEGQNYKNEGGFDALKLGQSLEWNFQKEEKGISWLDFD